MGRIYSSSGVGSSSDTQVLFNSAGVVTGNSGYTYNATNKAVTLGGATVTASAPVLDLSQTWNSGGVTFTGLKFSVTDTASASASSLLDLNVGGAVKFRVRKDGYIFPAGATATFIGGDTSQIWFGSASTNHFSYRLEALNYFTAASVAAFGWCDSSNGSSGTVDVKLFRDAANTLAQRNSTNAQTSNLYNTYTSSTVYERASMYASSNVFYLEPQKGGGGGTLRPFLMCHGAVAYSTLPSASACEGNVALVWGTTASGGGSSKTTVFSNGTNWLVG
jgi:hypothetical protein